MNQKTARLSLRITPSDKKIITARARELRLSVTDWLLRAALDREIVPPRSVWDAESINQLARIGNNLNQLAYWANTGVFVDDSSLHDIAVELRALRALLDDF
ncbi:plasmid mobilization relaxosome protein MobC [Pseudomonas sp. UL073]|uniref:Plasmid mobilization relaxosome protein MobC n=1 Tax=Zestomonas insulae TaxID=2809017 RepID=A0ABS2IFX1_9GAMM|nr:plasmid mobilization relaxosome protein MobC [Pseudomonas insulae]MBM7061058.1 plasmid mobilization relaxosome protein MobC [Pseudomonas insulae]